MLTLEEDQRPSAAEMRAVDAFFIAVERLEPYGYHVYYLTPDDAICAAPHLSRAAARAAICDNRDQWHYLSDGMSTWDLINEVFSERGLLPGEGDDGDSVDEDDE